MMTRSCVYCPGLLPCLSVADVYWGSTATFRRIGWLLVRASAGTNVDAGATS